MTKAFRIFISDPHAIFREGIKKIVAEIPECIIAGESDSAVGLKESLQKSHPDLLMIYTVSLKASLDIAESIRKEFPDLKIVLLTNTSRHPDLHSAITQGISGIIHKAISEKDLISAFEELKKGLPYYSQEVLPYLLKKLPALSQDCGSHKEEEWTPHEITILKYICKSHNNFEISQFLNLKCRTIEGHKSRMIEKACVPNTINLVLYAFKNKLISISDL